MSRTIFTEQHDAFRDLCRTFIEREVVPNHAKWEADGIVPRDVWLKAGEAGLLGFELPEQYGGQGIKDFRYNAILQEELAKVQASGWGVGVHNDINIPYFLLANDEQAARWFPGIASGDKITAVAMTEPGTGSDLAGIATTAIKQDDGSYLLNGSKTFISNGILADLVIVAAKTDPSQAHTGLSLLIVEADMEGFERGRNLDKIGMHAQDTAELFFNDVRVPAENLLGEEGMGFMYLVQNLAQERLTLGVMSAAGAEAALDLTLEYAKTRTAFGKPIGSFQNSRFQLAEMKTLTTILRTFADACLDKHTRGELTVEEAAMLKWWSTDVLCDVVDRCVQLHGGYGYMTEYPIARAYADARITKIFAGTNEIMKEIIGRGMGV